MRNVVNIGFDADDVLAALDRLSDEATNRVPRPAAQAGAQVFYDEMRQRAPRSDKGHWFHGSSFRKTGQKYWFEPGTLRAAIYQAFSKDNSGDGRATYHVAWNHQRAPYGFMVEYGTSRAPANAFMRPAFYAAQGIALSASRDKAVDLLRELIEEIGL